MPYDSTTYAPQVETPHRTIMPVEQTLIEARELISTPEKWGKGTCPGGLSRRGLLCANLAINSSHLWGKYEEAAAGIFVRVIGPLPRLQCASHWNDAPERTHADVMSAFDCAIALAAAEGA